MTQEPSEKPTELVTRIAQPSTARAGEEIVGQNAGQQAAEELMPLVYDELRRLAQSFVSRERPGKALQATALVHEAYLRMVDQTRVDWNGKTHFFAIAARMMRRLLVDDARQRGRQKRGGDWQRVTFLDSADPVLGRELSFEDVLSLDQAVERLRELDDRQASVVELRFFAGLDMAEVARHLGVSKRTVEGDWTHARAWLRRELSSG